MHGALMKREHAGLCGFFARECAAFLSARGRPSGAFSVLLTIDPLKQDVEQEVASKNANRHKHGKRHKDLTGTGVNV